MSSDDPQADDARTLELRTPVNRTNGRATAAIRKPRKREAQTSDAGRIIGYVDEVSDQQVTGWIMVRDQPSRRCTVAVKKGNRVLARGAASRFRADLLDAGIGDGCYAFAIPMPKSLLDGDHHLLEIVEQDSGTRLTGASVDWRSQIGTASSLIARRTNGAGTGHLDFNPTKRAGRASANLPSLIADQGMGVLFDISDLVYYIGHHPNLTGIQRVQSSIVLSIAKAELVPSHCLTFISFDARSQKWVSVAPGFLVSLLEDMFLPPRERLVAFSAEEARYGILPGAAEFDGVGVLDNGQPSVLCLLGAAWVQRDYFRRILYFKRRFGTKFVMTVHDLIPIYARETCDQGTARVFEEFLRRAVRHVDHWLSVSENTAKDLRRYVRSLGLAEPTITVTRNGSSFDEFMRHPVARGRTAGASTPRRFVLFVATIEGRKNHQLMFEVWRRMVRDGEDPPHLVCVGRVGWKSQTFIAELVETNYLNGKIVLLQDVSDGDLACLYASCLFTVCPSIYEGWGLPIGESLAAGKVCVCSDRASLPEVAGEFGVYIDIENAESTWQTIRRLIVDDAARRQRESEIRERYQPITWVSVASAVVAAGRTAVHTEWAEPYPYLAIPYSREISFAWLGHDGDSTFGDDLLSRVVDARKGHFLNGSLCKDSFLCGEDMRASGSWAEPESWGTWLGDQGGELILELGPDPSAVYYVFLRAKASGPARETRVVFRANGDVAWDGILGDTARDIVLRARKHHLSPTGWWRLCIRVDADLSQDAREQIAAIDSRMPTIGFERLVVIPENDVKTRLDVVSRLLL